MYNAVVLSKLLYASPAWCGFTSAANKQRLEASVRRAIRLGLYTADDPTPSQLAADMDDNLFANILNNPHLFCTNFSRTELVIPTILDLVVTRSLTVKTDCNNFLNRLLFKDTYYSFIICHSCVLSTVFIKEMTTMTMNNYR